MSDNPQDTIAAIKNIPTRKELLEKLSDWYYWITFTKLNGDERRMLCTLRKGDIVPTPDREDKLSQTKIRNLEDKVFVVWDVEKRAWRSFRYDRVTKVEGADMHTGGESNEP